MDLCWTDLEGLVDQSGRYAAHHHPHLGRPYPAPVLSPGACVAGFHAQPTLAHRQGLCPCRPSYDLLRLPTPTELALTPASQVVRGWWAGDALADPAAAPSCLWRLQEGELRPQLLDRFGMSVQVRAVQWAQGAAMQLSMLGRCAGAALRVDNPGVGVPQRGTRAALECEGGARLIGARAACCVEHSSRVGGSAHPLQGTCGGQHKGAGEHVGMCVQVLDGGHASPRLQPVGGLHPPAPPVRRCRC